MTFSPFADAVILAAGQGTRMPSPRPKVLQSLLEQSMLSLVFSSLHRMPELGNIVTVIGYKADMLRAELARIQLSLGLEAEPLSVEQTEQRGTGHALLTALPTLRALNGERSHVLLVYGDGPLLDSGLLSRFAARAKDDDVAFLSVTLADPAAYGRIVRSGPLGSSAPMQAIVEAKDYDAAKLGPPSGEINSGVCMFRRESLEKLLPLLGTNNKNGEFYLTDLAELGLAHGCKVSAVRAEDLGGTDRDILSLMGVNNPVELAAAEEALRREGVEALLASGVIVHAPESVRVSPTAQIEPGAELFGPCEIYGNSRIAFGARVESHCLLKNAVVGPLAEIRAFSHLEDAVVGEGCLVGPYARMRPGAVMEKNSHLGNFVEMKKARLGEGSKANHLTYLGDAEVGPGVNIGAGTITCNYDGKNKFKTEIGAGSFIGSNTALVAPVKLGQNSLIGAGSVITKDVPDNSLAVTRPKLTLLPRRDKD